MPLYVGLDVSQKETEICVVDEEGRRIWRGRCPSRPESITDALRRHAPEPARVGMETGPLPIWLWHGLRALGVPVDCLHARHVAAALSLQVNKTDANDAHDIAQVMRAGWYRVVAVNSLQSCRVRAVLSARSQLVAMRTGLYNQIRGLLNPCSDDRGFFLNGLIDEVKFFNRALSEDEILDIFEAGRDGKIKPRGRNSDFSMMPAEDLFGRKRNGHATFNCGMSPVGRGEISW